MSIEKWKGGRFWALYDESGELIAVVVYKRGAEEVRRRLQEQVAKEGSEQ